MNLLGKVSLIDYFLEHVNEVVVLTVDISNDDHWLSQSDYIWFLSYMIHKSSANALSNLLKILVVS